MRNPCFRVGVIGDRHHLQEVFCVVRESLERELSRKLGDDGVKKAA